MSITGFNRRRRELAKQAAKRQEPATTPEPVQPASTQPPKRRRKPKAPEPTNREE